ncbi:major intrinsically disordered Notch2-binding receptor 1 isoform 1-T2 [Thomomys bottae]
MEATQETSLFLEKILEELDHKQGTVSYQELCASLCSRLDLSQLARLRGALFYTACLDPNFPASLFKDKMSCAGSSPQAKKLAVAADILSIFNLVQVGVTPRDKLQAGGQKGRKKGGGSFQACRPDPELCDPAECEPLNCELHERSFSRGYPTRQSSKCQKADCPPFVPDAEPNFLLGSRKEAKHRVSSLDRLQAGAPYPVGGPQPCEMQRTCFPTSVDSESVSDPDSLAHKETFVPREPPYLAPSCVDKRNIFKDDFHNLVAASPALLRPSSKAERDHGEPQRRKEPHKAPFFNHSFEMPYHSQYLSPGYSPNPDRRRAKHESLDDLQASTYFGPTTPVVGGPGARRCPGKPSKQTPWPAKSWSLNTEEVPDSEHPVFRRQPSEEKPPFSNLGSQTPNFSAPERRPAFLMAQEPASLLPVGYAKAGGPAPRDLEFQDPAAGAAGLGSDTSSVGTQTDQLPPEPQKPPDRCDAPQAQYGDPLARKPSDADSEVVSDDISDIFRFLDDTGLVQSSCYNSTGSLSQLPKSDGDSSPEGRRRGGAAGGAEGARPSEAELQASVCRLVRRLGDIERKLESLSGVREEISQVLGKLNQLDQKIPPPENPPSPAAEPPPAWGGPDAAAAAGRSESLRVRALRRSLCARPSSRSLTEENSATESKMASMASSPGDWRALPRARRPSAGEPPHGAGPADDRKADRQHDIPSQHRLAKQPQDGFLVEQVFSPHPYPASLQAHRKSNPLYTDMRVTEVAEVKRGQPAWTLDEYVRNAGDKGKLAALDLQTQESLNPNNLEYWMEDIYTPGYDSLLKRKEAEFRRAKLCKMVALIVAAACTVLLVIVVPICTMKS